MRVIFRVDSGPTAGHRLLLRTGEILRVGRSTLNDFSVEHDDQMSDEHFQINVGESACFLVDADASSGTLVNGLGVQRVTLGDGDTIVAGTTRFMVQVEGASASTPAVENQGGMSATSLRATKPPPTNEPHDFCLETLASGLSCYRNSGELDPLSVAARLARRIPLYLIADFQRTGQPLPELAGGTEFLFNQLPVETAAAISPILLSAAECESWPTVAQALWNRNAIILMFTRVPQAEAYQHLRSLTQPVEEGDGMLGWCWPRVLGPLLECSEAAVTDRLIRDIDYFLVEVDGESPAWRLIGRESLSTSLQAIGWSNKKADF